MKTPNEHYVTERNVIDQYSFDDVKECREAFEELKSLHPKAEVLKDEFPQVGKYWVSVVDPIAK